MIYLLPDTPNQVAYMTLQDGRLFLPSSYSDYLMQLRSMTTNELFFVVLGIVSENTMWTQVTIDTTGIAEGEYEYTIFAQNSPSNTDPNDDSVVGKVESGIVKIESEINYVTLNGTATQQHTYI